MEKRTTRRCIVRSWRTDHGRNVVARSAKESAFTSSSFAEQRETVVGDFTISTCSISNYKGICSGSDVHHYPKAQETNDMNDTAELRLPALEITQGPKRMFYSFAVDGKLLPTFTTVSRIHRNGDNLLAGYQRPEVLSHIAEIRNYLESNDP